MWGGRSPRRVPLLRVDEAGLADRGRIWLLEAAHVLLAVPSSLVFVLIVAGWPTATVGVGFLLLHLAVPSAARLGRVHRHLAGLALHRPVEVRDHQRPRERGAALLWGGPLTWVQDPRRWLDLAFAAFAATGGLVMSAIVVALPAGVIAHVVLPFVFPGLWWMVLLIPLDLALWWILGPVLCTARAITTLAMFGSSRTAQLERRVAAVSESRAETIDHSAAEIRRIERDLHDGAQARIVSLGMNIGLAEQLLHTDPAAAAALLAEARQATTDALEDLRGVVRSIHPPVLADRGLAGAVEALTVQMSVPVITTADLPDPIPAPIETAVYFAVAEALANVVKHAGAHQAWVRLEHRDNRLRTQIGDDGTGGASLDGGSGLAGVARRLRAFDGTLDIDSPAGGPTTVTVEVPCASSSPKT
ncbi:sensor domain-containing protein [Kineosporia sp. J2-2]|uniref:histidine kinase n=1 Tax=Kineosporia corallincola TaxID=2835133 RepID=A0ABS5TSL0_9ACTN|nr:histidine kinase [Kineosporia corallincola]MBT0773797.1 sensor domain-containing protein [Kineosporia corallincola]